MTRLALLQSRAFPSKTDAFHHHEGLIRKAADDGARIIVTQELFLTPYFCITHDTLRRDPMKAIGVGKSIFSHLSANRRWGHEKCGLRASRSALQPFPDYGGGSRKTVPADRESVPDLPRIGPRYRRPVAESSKSDRI